ncbi:hypothetical protein JG688_00001620 [Phytophthora aleatoria]|uniref:PPM-type phosphatase domain-containing protein n=1 Tax=Phytophthora aleatoria TaxID=2496075 RepID=A0A8J5MD74_9STRA|nr:hypothetical protein JG688_00001620 [Phytophthora aleatoria]
MDVAATDARADSAVEDVADIRVGQDEIHGSGSDTSNEENQEQQGEQAASKSADRTASNQRFHLFAVVDGHAGARTADFLVEELFKTLDGVYDNGFDQAKLSKVLEELDSSGAQCCDCRAIIQETPESADAEEKGMEQAPSSTEGKTSALSEDHCTENEKEIVRALLRGADISDKRIDGILASFRAFGDGSSPRLRSIKANCSLVAASWSYGVWKVLSNDHAMEAAVTVRERLQGGIWRS